MYNNSHKAFDEAKKFIPGGVNSPVRAFKSVNSTPVFFEKGQGSKMFDIDGNEYICLLYTSPSPRDSMTSRMPSSA